MFTTGSLMRDVSISSFIASIGLMAINAVDLIDLLFISMLGYEALAAAAGYAGAFLSAPGVLIGQALSRIFFACLAIWLGFRLMKNPPDDRVRHRHHYHLFGHHSQVMHFLHKHAGHR